MSVAATGVPAEVRGLDRLVWSVPPPLLMLMGMVSFQLGAAFAKVETVAESGRYRVWRAK